MSRRQPAHARRRRGEGSIRAKGAAWEVRYLDANGDRRSRSFDSERGAVAFLAAASVARSTGDIAGGSQQRLVDYLLGLEGPGGVRAGGWLGSHGGSVRPATVAAHRGNIVRYIVPALGRVRLADLRGSHVVQLQTTMRQRGLLPGTIRSAHSTLGVALEAALRDRLISHNPTRLVTRPPASVRTVRGAPIVPPSLADIRLVESCLVDPVALAYRVTVATGCRVGEVRALRWSDVSTAGVVLIAGNWSRSANERGPVKSTAGERARAVSPRLSGALSVWRTTLAAAGMPVDGDALVFPSDRRRGRPISAEALRVALHAAQRAAGVAPFRWHDLRHAHATILRERGDDMLAVSRAMGHSRLAVTSDLYGHVDVLGVAPIDDSDGGPA